MFILATVPTLSEIGQLPWTAVTVFFGSAPCVFQKQQVLSNGLGHSVSMYSGREPRSTEHSLAASSGTHSLARVHVYKQLGRFVTELGVRLLPGAAHSSLLSLCYQIVFICL